MIDKLPKVIIFLDRCGEGLIWAVPPRCNRHHQDYEAFLVGNPNLPSLKLTAKAPENRPGPKRKGLSSKHPFSGANLLLVSGRVFKSSFATTGWRGRSQV